MIKCCASRIEPAPLVRRSLVKRLLLLMPIGAVLLVWEPAAARDSGPGADIEQKVRDVLRAEYSHEASPRYRALFKACGTAGLAALKLHRHDGIAIQAAFEEVRLTVSKKPDSEMRPDQKKLTWILGFLEGRARVQVPQWWAEAILDSRANNQGRIYCGNLPDLPYHQAGPDGGCAPRDTTLKRQGDKMVLSVGEESAAIPEDLLRKNDHGGVSCYISALFKPLRCYIAVHGDVGYPYVLACIDRKSAKVIWKTKVWATWWGFAVGIHNMWVTVTEQEQRVVVFGVATTGIHMEAFRPDDGRNLFRFASSY